MERALHMNRAGIPPMFPRLPKKAGASRDYSVVSYKEYFDSKFALSCTEEAGISFNCYSSQIDRSPLLLCLHGAGFTGLTWALFAQSIQQRICVSVLAPDQRGHGETHGSDADDLSMTRMRDDVVALVAAFCRERGLQQPPPIVLVGHSMGGAVATNVAEVLPSVVALVVIDIVEGSAMEGLHAMRSLLASRPHTFPTLERAVEWAVRSGQTRNKDAARVSMPSQLKEKTVAPGTVVTTSDTIAEEDDMEAKVSSESQTQKTVYEWRIDLEQTEPYWQGWFKGLSQRFLTGTPAPKLLLLAGVDRLDKDLTIGQMQGKFQMVVLPRVGHSIQEDSPDKVADAIATFLLRNKLAEKCGEFEPVFPGC